MEESEDGPSIRQFSWGELTGLNMMVPVHIGQQKIAAIVDTAAQVTLISTSLREQVLATEGLDYEVVQLRNAQKDSTMPGKLWKHVGFQLGGRKYFMDIVEANIGDNFILGLDFLKGHKCKIDLEEDILEMETGERIHASMKTNDVRGTYHVSRVLMHKRVSIPANTMKVVAGKLENPAQVPFMLESAAHPKVFAMPLMLEGAPSVSVCMVNLSDSCVTLKRNTEIGQAVEVDAMIDFTTTSSGDSKKVTGIVHVRGNPDDDINEDHKVCVVRYEESAPNVRFDTSDTEGINPANTGDELGRCDDTSTHAIGTKDTKSGMDSSTETTPPCESTPSDEPAQDRKLPPHVQQMYDDACTRISAEQAKKLHAVLLEYADLFATHDLDIGKFNVLVHWIKTGDAFPIKQRMRRTPMGFEKEEKKTVDSMLGAGVIEPSTSDWASPPVLVRKKDNSWRYCLDFRALNNVTVKDAYPLPLIEDCLDSLAGKSWFSTLDMNSGYWQIPLAEEDKKKTAFMTRYGLFQFTRMPFGLANGPATFQRAMHHVLSGLIWDAVVVYLDDISVVGETFEENLENLVEVLGRFRKFGLKLKASKSVLFKRETKFLGRLVNASGIHVTDDHIRSVQEWPVPTNRKELERFLGFVNYHREFVQDMAEKTAELYALTGAKASWAWKEEHTKAFQELKKTLVSPPVLAFPNATDTFILDTDASDLALGAELSQIQDGKERTIAYASKSLNGPRKTYCTTRKELLAVVVFTNHFRHYLLGRTFILRTDHASLVWLMRFKSLGGQLSRWLQALSEYNFRIEHRSGRKHVNADALSRMNESRDCDCGSAGQTLGTLPCNGCSFCAKVQESWERFDEEVDDVLPLVRTVFTLGSDDSNAFSVLGRTCQDPGSSGEDNCGNATVQPQFEDRHQGELGSTCQGSPMVHIAQVKTLNDTDEQTPADDGDISNYMQQYTNEQVRMMQLQDPDLGPLILWLEGEDPTEGDLRLQSQATRHFWLCRSQLKLAKGVLTYLWEDVGGQTPLLLVPRKMQKSILELFHDAPTGGHLGRDNTIAKIRQRYLWYGLSTDVRLHVTACPRCGRGKHKRNTPRAPLTNYQGGFPGDRVHLDILGPFCESTKGNRYVLMIIDQFSRWLEVVPLKVMDAEAVAQAFFENYVVRFGVPFVIHTDQGRNFDSALFKSFCAMLQSIKTRTTPYRPCSNGQVERYNTLVLNFLRCYLGEKQREWDAYLPVLGMCVRSTVNRSTGFTPNMLRLGYEVQVPADIMFGVPSDENRDTSPAEFIINLRCRMEEAFTEARKRLRSAQERQKAYYDVKARMMSFDVGDVVYRRNSAFKVGDSRKLNPLYTGPYLVTEVISPILYRVESQKKEYVLHHDRLHICEEKAIPIWVQRKRHQLGLQEIGLRVGTPVPGADTENTDEATDEVEERLSMVESGDVMDDDSSSSDGDSSSGEEEEDSNIASLFEPQVTRAGRQRRTPKHFIDYVF